MKHFKRQYMLESFLDSDKEYELVIWWKLGYADHTSARSCLERVIKQHKYNCHMARSGNRLYLVRNGFDIPRTKGATISVRISQCIWRFISSDDKSTVINDILKSDENVIDLLLKTSDMVYDMGYSKHISVHLEKKQIVLRKAGSDEI